ncbi:hypothetical protein [Variovorax sp. KK3]|uniref:hypothetical protein n=1 Tax=Variovorax sp. KK3 TaxID=1855728 RepID=UPI00118095D0|nr:hypothetical protein [Variovorax sp. KK3]
MNKPEINVPGVPYDFDAIPRWIEPNLWNLTSPVRYRRTKIAVLYALSCIGMGTTVCLPIYLFLGIGNGFASGRALGIWFLWLVGVAIAPAYGLTVLWDFAKANREAVKADEHQG